MKGIGKKAVKFSLALALVLSISLIPAMPFAVASPGNEVHVEFYTVQSHSTDADSTEDVPFPIVGKTSMDTGSNIYNLNDEGHDEVIFGPSVTFAATSPVMWVSPDWVSEDPWIWDFLDIEEDQGQGRWATLTTDPYNLTPGFSASREFDITEFNSSGPQELTITVTPEEAMDELQITVHTCSCDGMNASIVEPIGPTYEGEDIDWSPQQLNIYIPDPDIGGDGYTWTITIQVDLYPETISANYKPMVWVSGNIAEFPPDTVITDTMIGNIEELAATWTWYTAEDNLVSWTRWDTKRVVLNELCEVETEEELNEVHFETHNWYSHTPEGDTFFNNNSVDGTMFWAVNGSNNQFVTGEPITGLELFLDTDLSFNWHQLSLDETVSVDLIEEELPPSPYDYHWSVSEVPVGYDVSILVHPTNPDDAPVNFEPGFDVVRWVDKTEFAQADGTQTQTLTVVVTPREDYTYITNNIFIYVAADNNTIIPTDVGNSVEAVASPLPGDNWFSTPDGHFVGVFFADWETGKPITTEIEIEVTPNVSIVEYMPTIWVFEVVESEEYGENFFGNTLVMEQPLLGTWTWTTDTDRWIGWRTNVLLKGITFPSVHPGVENFSIGSMFIDFGEGTDLDEISITEATFNLAEDATYDLIEDDITVIVDGVTITIPAGSFNKIGGPSSEKYIYNSKGTEQTKIQMVIDFDEGVWSLIARNIDASLVDNSDGVTVIFSVDANAAIERIYMQVGGLSYIAGQ